MPELANVWRFALALPETVEKTYFGMPGFRVQDKGFVTVTKDGTRGRARTRSMSSLLISWRCRRRRRRWAGA